MCGFGCIPTVSSAHTLRRTPTHTHPADVPTLPRTPAGAIWNAGTADVDAHRTHASALARTPEQRWTGGRRLRCGRTAEPMPRDTHHHNHSGLALYLCDKPSPACNLTALPTAISGDAAGAMAPDDIHCTHGRPYFHLFGRMYWCGGTANATTFTRIGTLNSGRSRRELAYLVYRVCGATLAVTSRTPAALLARTEHWPDRTATATPLIPTHCGPTDRMPLVAGEDTGNLPRTLQAGRTLWDSLQRRLLRRKRAVAVNARRSFHTAPAACGRLPTKHSHLQRIFMCSTRRPRAYTSVPLCYPGHAPRRLAALLPLLCWTTCAWYLTRLSLRWLLLATTLPSHLINISPSHIYLRWPTAIQEEHRTGICHGVC